MSLFHPLTSPLLFLFLFCLSQVRQANALGVQIVTPGPGATLPPGPFSVTWTDGGGSPDLSNLTTYELVLYVGGNSPSNSKALLTLSPPNAVASDLSLHANIPSDIGQSIQNGYYLCMTSNTTNGNQVINYSGRFTLISLNGTTADTYVTGAGTAIGDLNVPNEQYNTITQPTAPANTTTPSSSASPSASSTASAEPASASQSTTSISKPALAGLAVGSLAACILFLVLLAVAIVWWRRKRRAQKKTRDVEEEPGRAWPADKVELADTGPPTPLAELSPEQGRFEAMDRDKVVEADSQICYELEGDWAGWEAAARRSRAYDPTL